METTTRTDDVNITAARRTGWMLAAYLAIIVLYWILYAKAPAFHQRWLRGEDKFIEWMTFVGFIGASAALWPVLRRARPLLAKGWLAGLAFFFFVCAGEELSWGQRIFGFKTPEKIEKSNEQHEFNLHNHKWKHFHPLALVSLFMKIFGIVAPVVAMNRWPRFVPVIAVAPSFLFAEALSAVEKMVKPDLAARYGPEVAKVVGLDTAEIKEMVWGLSCLLAALALRAAWAKSFSPRSS